jgi:hypothetical protein
MLTIAGKWGAIGIAIAIAGGLGPWGWMAAKVVLPLLLLVPGMAMAMGSPDPGGLLATAAGVTRRGGACGPGGFGAADAGWGAGS